MKLNYRTVIFAIAIVFGVFFSVPSLFQTQEGKKVTLGLDLQGGLHMLLGVKTQEAVKSRIKSIAASIKHFSERKDILVDSLSFDESVISFTLLDSDDLKTVQEYLAEIEGAIVAVNAENISITLSDEEIIRTEKQAISQAIETIRNRLDQFGLAEPVVARQGEEKILVQLAGIKTQEEEQRARELISRSAKLELMAVDEDRAARVYTMSDSDAAAYGDVILEDVANSKIKHLVREIPILDGGMLTDAHVGFDQNNRPLINFSLNAEGAEIFGDFTGKNVGNHLAVVLDGKVYSAPVINERIGGGSGQISGDYTVMEAKDLAIALRSGSLLAPVYLMEKRSVGPSLGADSIKASMVALIGGFILVIVFMVVYYRVAGIIANIALVANLFIILAVMSLFGATLTLPGMAGIVLTVGMAVDANVIISERIRELIYQGVSIHKAIEDGYANAMRAILDANITTLIAAVVLYAYGTGAIKGFAITISIGILASMLTAILGTHGIYTMLEKRIQKSKNNRLWFGIKG
ncbi:MAG: protein translocase subunit SecD [Sulfurimonas sp.]|uniref:protein translocase subunit SecD n=1 Tax=Sulfurimonas sp. TaxID=2022749 RepID=UPI00262D1E79|nr:protein translocase subunit SecD [Sulfurimonas sp.]MCW8895916.1 protein translocase subunit SecD [Sulfurimonas sp.]MCW8954484.1 protein translocase subunit SecD [Sulfurimonas sp.]MCW9067892.1 protein translocase subunit SecD [Sulfurimonas sp.]